MLDLLHQAQREGWLRLQRDRKGVWRIFTVSPTGLTPAEPAAAAAPVTEVEAGASTDFWESGEILTAPAEATELTEEPPLEVLAENLQPAAVAGLDEAGSPVIEESAAVESVQAEPVTGSETSRRGRKPRAAKSPDKSTARRGATRRKTKEPTTE
jgi:hypothetical protein